MNFKIVEYAMPERITQPVTSRMPHPGFYATHEDAVKEIHRMLRNDEWKVTGYNEERDYYWGRDRSPSARIRMLRVER